MKKILVAVDGSPQSLGAARLGQEIASATGASLTLAYSVPMLMPAGDLPLLMMGDVVTAELERGRLLLAEAVKQLGDTEVRTIELEGPAAERIADLAENDGYDLVVVGSRGRNAVARVFLGSVADRLVHICKKSVLVAR